MDVKLSTFEPHNRLCGLLASTAQIKCKWNSSMLGMNSLCGGQINFRSNFSVHGKKPPKLERAPRRPKLPPQPAIHTLKRTRNMDAGPSYSDTEKNDIIDDGHSLELEEKVIWRAEEIEAISSLFQGRVPQKPGKLTRKRELPLPLPHKLRPVGLPTVKRFTRTSSLRRNMSVSFAYKQLYKDPCFLVNLARDVQSLPVEQDVSVILEKWGRFLRKGSLCLTIRELGQMGLPVRALQTLCWAQRQPHLFPDDRILAATVEILAATNDLKFHSNLEKFIGLGSRAVLEAMAKGFIKANRLDIVTKLLLSANESGRTLHSSVYVKLILELGKNPDKSDFVVSLLEELAGRDDMDLSQTDCSAIMKVCVKLGKFEIVETLHKWFKDSGYDMNVVMYTSLIHSRYSQNRVKEALALVWEMEASNCQLDLPAFRVVIKLFVALNDLSRAVRYFSKIKEVGISPSYDIYRDMIYLYMISGRLAKCKAVCKEVELAGFKLDPLLNSQLLQLEWKLNSGA